MPVLSDKARKAKIRFLNDTLRRTFTGGKVMTTSAFANLDDSTRAAVMDKVRTFSDFDLASDPHGEHDFVKVEHQGERYFAKIDYYDPKCEYGSEDPADPAKTCRVLTIMRAEDY